MKSISKLIIAAATVAGISAGASAAQTITIGGTGSPLGAVQKLADAYMAENPDTKIVVLPSLGSGGGIKALAAGRIELALSARELKDTEAAQGLTAALFATTPIVFATRASNPTEGASLAWIADAYAGVEDSWPDGTRVRLILRPLHDSDSVILSSESQILKEAIETAHTRPGLVVAENAQVAAGDLESLDGSLGTSTLTQILSEGRAIRPLSLEGIAPTAETVADGTYPFRKDFFLVTPEKMSDAAEDFLAFARSDAGRAVLTVSGNLPAN